MSYEFQLKLDPFDCAQCKKLTLRQAQGKRRKNYELIWAITQRATKTHKETQRKGWNLFKKDNLRLKDRKMN